MTRHTHIANRHAFGFAIVAGLLFAGGTSVSGEEPPVAKGEVEVSPSDRPLPPANRGGMLGNDAVDAYSVLPKVVEGRFELPDIAAISTSTSEIGNGKIPDGFRGGDSPVTALPEDPSQRGESWGYSVSNWAAADTFSHPRYFEDRMLERHGHERYPLAQPFVSGARFFATVPMLPYLMTVRPPCECESTLGYYRSGSCAPGVWQRPPLECRAVLAESAVVSGLIVAFP